MQILTICGIVVTILYRFRDRFLLKNGSLAKIVGCNVVVICYIRYLIILANPNSLRKFSCLDSRTAKASVSGAEPSAGGDDVSEMIEAMEVESSSPGASFLAKVAVVLGIAATATVIMKQPSSGPSFSLPQIIDASAQSDAAAATIGYTFSLFGKKAIIPEYTPGYVHMTIFVLSFCFTYGRYCAIYCYYSRNAKMLSTAFILLKPLGRPL